MLNVDSLKQDLQEVFEDTIPSAFEQALLGIFVDKSDSGDAQAKQFGENISKMLSETWASRLATIIDAYIKTGVIYGTIVTQGSPITQTAIIAPSVNLGNPTAGTVPNTLGIQ